MNNFFKANLFLFFYFFLSDCYSQCSTNVIACDLSTNPVFSFVPKSPNTQSSCLELIDSSDAAYITTYVSQSGNLNMLIDGNSDLGYLDVGVYNVPNGIDPCIAIQNINNEIQCNFADFENGCNQLGNSFPCDSSVPAPFVTAGQTIIIVVENWSNASSTFTIQLGNTPGSAQFGLPDTTINPVGDLCTKDSPIQLTASNNGGNWSGTGVSPFGIFDPSISGPGTHVINYSIGNGACSSATNSIAITVNPSSFIENVVVADTSVCSSTNSTNNVYVEISVNTSGVTYNWNAIPSGVSIAGGITSGTITSTSETTVLDFQVTTNDPLVAGSIYFEVSSVSTNACPGNTLQSEIITINPNPSLPISSPTKTICSGEDTDLIVDVSPLITGTELTWEVLTVVNVLGANPGTGIAPVTINDALTATTNTQGYVIYRVHSILGECQGGFTDYRINVNPLPQPILANGNICTTADGEMYETYTLNTGLNDSDYDFEWFDSNGNIIPGSTSSTLVVGEAGTYSVIARNTLTGCTSDPLLADATATVTVTQAASSTTVVQSEYFSDNTTLTVTVTGGSGTLLYALDGESFQSSNVFVGVNSGNHLVSVVDSEGCTLLTQLVTVIDYPKYFTPNGDGINDTWNINSLNQEGAKLYIFDRYGKLLKQLSATNTSESWDGTYNQELLPSADYWFTLDYLENGTPKQFKSHFTLKR